jgi:hypothetical protein
MNGAGKEKGRDEEDEEESDGMSATWFQIGRHV